MSATWSLLCLLSLHLVVFANVQVETQAGLINLRDASKPIPLVGVYVNVTVRDFTAHVVIEQHYTNDEDVPIEAQYIFPLDELSAIHLFEAHLDGKILRGKVKKTKEATRDYREAVKRGDGAYLLKQNKPNLFTMSVGNLLPKSSVVLKIGYVSELRTELDDGVRLVLPTTVFPRYQPAKKSPFPQDNPKVLDSIKYAYALPYGLKITVLLQMSVGIASVTSPEHSSLLDIEVNATTAKVWSNQDVAMDKDVVIIVRMLRERIRHRTSILLENLDDDFLAYTKSLDEKHVPANVAVALHFWPDFNYLKTNPETKMEIVFLIDRSGSMSHTINQARITMYQILKNLPPNCLFNIVGFGSHFTPLFAASQPYHTSVIEQARAYISTMGADMGGTEILSPIRSILSAPLEQGVQRQLFVLSDGEVSNTVEVIRYVGDNSANTRVFGFAIGNFADKTLIDGISKAGNGHSVYVDINDPSMEEKVVFQLQKAAEPTLTDIKLVWKDEHENDLDSSAVALAPIKLPPMFNKKLYTVYALFNDDFVFDSVSLEGSGKEGKVTFSAHVSSLDDLQGSYLHVLAARARIRELEEGQQSNAIKDEIALLSLTYQLTSSQTSFIIVEEREVKQSSPAQRRDVPLGMPKSCKAALNDYVGASVDGDDEDKEFVRYSAPSSSVAKPTAAVTDPISTTTTTNYYHSQQGSEEISTTTTTTTATITTTTTTNTHQEPTLPRVQPKTKYSGSHSAPVHNYGNERRDAHSRPVEPHNDAATPFIAVAAVVAAVVAMLL